MQQLSGVTQTCATKSLGMVWKMGGCLEGSRALILGRPLKIYQAHSHTIWQVPELGLALLWGLCMGCSVPGSFCCFGENGGSLELGVPLPQSFTSCLR